MKTVIALFIAIFNILSIHGQVGINTKNPVSEFHIDGKKSNPPTGTPTNEQLSDDLVINSTEGTPGNKTMNAGIGAIPNISTQLELGGTRSALILNRADLKSPDDLETVPNPEDGMIVFNEKGTYATATPPMGRGFYAFTEGKWAKIVTEIITSIIEFRDLSAGFTVNTRDSEAHATPNSATVMKWHNVLDENLAKDTEYIDIKDDGSYAFALRLNMTPENRNSTERALLYVWLIRDYKTTKVKSNTTSGNTAWWLNNGAALGTFSNGEPISPVADSAELNIPTVSTNTQTCTVVLTLPYGIKGEKVHLRIGSKSGFTNPTCIASPTLGIEKDNVEYNPARTSLIFWKL
jgi:hypothetical protein